MSFRARLRAHLQERASPDTTQTTNGKAPTVTTGAPAVEVTLHFGPYASPPLADEHSLFAEATKLLRAVMPDSVQFTSDGTLTDTEQPTSASAPQEGASLPFLRLPAVLVEADEEDEEEEEDNEHAQNAGDVVVMTLGRAALEVRTYSHNIVVVSTWPQWEVVRGIVVDELGGTTGARNSHEGTPFKAEQQQQREALERQGKLMRSVTVEIHVELVVLWYDEDTMKALRFEDLFVHADHPVDGVTVVDGQPLGDGGPQREQRLDAIRARVAERLLAEKRHETAAAEATRRTPEHTPATRHMVAHSQTEGTTAQRLAVASSTGAQAVGGPTRSPLPQQTRATRHDEQTLATPSPLPPPLPPPLQATTSPAPHRPLHVTLAVADGGGVVRGAVAVYVTDPVTSLEEMRAMVRAQLGLPRHRGMRLAYRVLPPQELFPGYIGGGGEGAGDGAQVRGAQEAWITHADHKEVALLRHAASLALHGHAHRASRPLGLVPLSSQGDVEELVEHILFYGARAICLVAVESETGLNEGRALLRSDTNVPQRLQGHASHAASSDARRQNDTPTEEGAVSAQEYLAWREQQALREVERVRSLVAPVPSRPTSGVTASSSRVRTSLSRAAEIEEDATDAAYLRRIQSSLESLRARRRLLQEEQRLRPSTGTTTTATEGDDVVRGSTQGEAFYASMSPSAAREQTQTRQRQQEGNPDSKDATTPIRFAAHTAPRLEEPVFSPPPRAPSGSASPTHRGQGGSLGQHVGEGPSAAPTAITTTAVSASAITKNMSRLTANPAVSPHSGHAAISPRASQELGSSSSSSRKPAPVAPYSSSTQVLIDAASKRKTTTTMTVTAKQEQTESAEERQHVVRHLMDRGSEALTSSLPDGVVLDSNEDDDRIRALTATHASSRYHASSTSSLSQQLILQHQQGHAKADRVRVERGSSTRTRRKREVMIIRYEVDPTEIHVSGPATPEFLRSLADNVYRRCCCYGKAPAEGGRGPQPEFEKATPESGEEEDAISTSVNGTAPSNLFILKLHEYDFNEEQEDQLSACITEAMQRLGELAPMEL